MTQLSFTPMGFGEVLDAAFQIYRRSFWQFVIAQAAMAIPIAVLRALTLAPPPPPGDAAAAVSYFIAQLPWTLITGFLELIQLAAVATVAEQVAYGKPVSSGGAYLRALQRLPQLVAFGILAAMAVGIGTVIVIIPGIVAFVWLVQGLFFVVLDKDGAIDAISRSYRLAAGYFWRILGIIFMAVLVVGILNFLASLLATALAGPQNGHDTIMVIETVFNILIGSFPLIALYVQHLDLRARKGEAVASGAD